MAMNVNYIQLPEVDSTNNYLMRIEPTGADEVTVVWTDCQTSGRGCGTNSWESEPGKNLTFSIGFRPCNIPARNQFILSMANAVALKRTLDAYTDGISIKWPNDIYWHDRKLCGTLIETSLEGSYIRRCIIGTGINVNQRMFLSDAPNPVSLYQILGHELDREKLLRQVMENFVLVVNRVGDGQADDIREEYRAALYRRNEVHPYLLPNGERRLYMLTDVTDDGHLLLTTPDGLEQHSFAFKEVQFHITQ